MKKVLMALCILFLVVGCQSKQSSVENAFFSDGLLAVEKDSMWGYINNKGDYIIPAVYDQAGAFHDGKAIVSINGQAQLINKEGHFILEDYVDLLYRDEETNLLIYRKNGRSGLMSAGGKVLTAALFDSISTFSEGYAIIKAGIKYGYINTSGKIVISLTYDHAKRFSNGLAPVKKDDAWGYIDKDNDTIIAFDYSMANPFDTSGNAIVQTTLNTTIKTHLINKKQVTILSDADNIMGNGPLYVMKKGSDYTLHESDGSQFSNQTYTNVWYLNGYQANLEYNGEDLNVMFKSDGTLLDQAPYNDSDLTTIMYEGKELPALVIEDGSFIDVVLDSETIRLEADNIIQVLTKNRYIIVRSNKVGIINDDNEIVVEFLYDFMSMSNDGFIGFVLNNQIGFLDGAFKNVIEATYDDICIDINIYTV